MIQSVSPGWSKTLGHSDVELYGQRLTSILGSDELPDLASICTAQPVEVSKVDLSFTCKNGKTLFARSLVVPFQGTPTLY